MLEHSAIRSRVGNVLFVRFRRHVAAADQARTCRSCAHWCGGMGGDGSGRCLADCGARVTNPDRSCGEWRHPPVLTVV
jgi:hypothetical protein